MSHSRLRTGLRSSGTTLTSSFAAALVLAGACAPSASSMGLRSPSAAELKLTAQADDDRAASASPEEAERLRAMAAERRSEAHQLEAVAAQACLDVPALERDQASFLQPNQIESVGPFLGERRLIKTWVKEVRGAAVVVRATQGMTKQWVARVLRCHIAWRRVVDGGPRRRLDDPFDIAQADLSFDETETGFLIRIVGHDKAEGEEILRRTQRLAEPRPSESRAAQ
jgi:hypothetical protein